MILKRNGLFFDCFDIIDLGDCMHDQGKAVVRKSCAVGGVAPTSGRVAPVRGLEDVWRDLGNQR